MFFSVVVSLFEYTLYLKVLWLKVAESRGDLALSNISSPLSAGREHVFTQGRRHTLGYRCSETCCRPDPEAYTEKEHRNLTPRGKTLLSVLSREKSVISATTTVKPNAGSNTLRNHAPRLYPALNNNTTTTTSSAGPLHYNPTTLKWSRVHKNTHVTYTLLLQNCSCYTYPFPTALTSSYPEHIYTPGITPISPTLSPPSFHLPSLPSLTLPHITFKHPYSLLTVGNKVFNLLPPLYLHHGNNTLPQPTIYITLIYFRSKMDEGFMPERLPISGIDYLTGLYKEVQVAYLRKAIQRNLLDGDLLLADHQRMRDLIHPVLEQTSQQGKPAVNKTHVTQTPIYICNISSSSTYIHPQTLNKTIMQDPSVWTPVFNPAYTPANTPSPNPRLVRIFHHGAIPPARNRMEPAGGRQSVDRRRPGHPITSQLLTTRRGRRIATTSAVHPLLLAPAQPGGTIPPPLCSNHPARMRGSPPHPVTNHPVTSHPPPGPDRPPRAVNELALCNPARPPPAFRRNLNLLPGAPSSTMLFPTPLILARPTPGAPGRHHTSPPRHLTPLPVMLSPPQLICAPAGWRPPLHRASLHLPPTLQEEHTTMHNNSEVDLPADKEYTASYLSDNTLPPFPELKIPEFYASNCNNELLEMEKIANQIKITALLVKTRGNETSLRTLYNCLQGYRAIISVLKNRIAPGKQDQEGILYRADTRKNWIRNLELLELRNRTVLLNSNKVKLFTNSLTNNSSYNTYLSNSKNTNNKPNPCIFSGHSEQTRRNQPLD